MLQYIFKAVKSSVLARYIVISVFVCVIDTAIVWSLFRLFQIELVTANSAGVITGFLIHYRLSSKSVFRTNLGMKGFVVYFGTFLLGLFMADWLIYYGEQVVFHNLNTDLSFLCSKGISVFIPFFLLYFIRKAIFSMINKEVTQS